MINAWILEVQLPDPSGSYVWITPTSELQPLRPFPGSAALQGQRFLQRHRSLFPGGMGRKSIKHCPGSPTETVRFSETTKATPIAFPISITFWSEHKSGDRNMLQKQDRSFKLPRFTAAHLTNGFTSSGTRKLLCFGHKSLMLQKMSADGSTLKIARP